MAEAREQTTERLTPRMLWQRRWRWALVVLFAFLAFESFLIAVALQGPWLVLLAPGAVCGIKAIETYRNQDHATRRG